MTIPPDKAEGSICIGCGLCCDGTLHGTATVKPSDEPAVTAVGLEIVDDGERRFFRQPCPHFSCGSCSVYARRPAVCRDYRCALLKNLEAGTIDASTAREKIATAKDLVAAVRIIDPNAVTPAERSRLAQRLREELGQLEGEDRLAAAKTLLDTAALEHFLDRWFLKRKKRKEEESPPSDMAEEKV